MDVQAKREALDAAYRRGDHLLSRALAKELLADREASEDIHARAQQVLRETRIDPFIFLAAVAGLGLVAFLVYKYAP